MSVDVNRGNILVSNVKLNCYLIFCVKLYEIDKEIFENNSQILNLKKFILGSATSVSYPKINEENITYFLDSYKKGTSSFMFLNKFIGVYTNAVENAGKAVRSKFDEETLGKVFKGGMCEEGIYSEFGNFFNESIEKIFSYYFFIFDLLTVYVDKNIDIIKKEFRELISFDAFDDFTANEYASLLKDDFYYKTLSEKTMELYKRFSID